MHSARFCVSTICCCCVFSLRSFGKEISFPLLSPLQTYLSIVSRSSSLCELSCLCAMCPFPACKMLRVLRCVCLLQLNSSRQFAHAPNRFSHPIVPFTQSFLSAPIHWPAARFGCVRRKLLPHHFINTRHLTRHHRTEQTNQKHESKRQSRKNKAKDKSEQQLNARLSARAHPNEMAARRGSIVVCRRFVGRSLLLELLAIALQRASLRCHTHGAGR